VAILPPGFTTISTGRELRDNGWPEGNEAQVVMLDGEATFDALDAAQFNIWWGAHLGMKEEILIFGPLRECCNTIKI
jgi:precorrin-6A synthase